MYDVVIVGAGPAGSTAALVAARLGLKAAVIDRLQPPREKPCGGGLTPRTWKLLNRLGVEYPVYGSCQNIETRAAGYRYVLRKEPILITRRPEFDYAILRQSNAEFIKDHVLGVEGGRVLGRAGEYQGRVVIGADGATSAVARSIGVVNYRQHKSHAIAYMTIARGPTTDTCVIDFDAVVRKTGRAGYAWVFPLEGGANVGAGVGWGSWLDLRSFVVEYAEGAGYKPGPVLGHPLSLGYTAGLGRGNVLLAGEAAGLVDATTGEGIYYAVSTGAAAATAAYVALKIYGNEKRALEIYRGLVEPYVQEVKKTRWLSRMAKTLGTMRWVAKLLGRRLLNLYSKVYTGEATYSLLLKPVERR
ncbi:geranylgeranyl reductase [Pyrobaculum neutrophilum V24Sta]|uniref:Geranylgeranyl reductase n=1 Tax=Pyrobaculum neutrophilum (strain DSM 2338 / JCM 9278 / NBRC 100436 / V24Sta) TaxID=444157 RepID=B1YAK8_PYRNV|nr:geranylgeranyl reductase [Pyrobaculum neutrophilum V24Sta]